MTISGFSIKYGLTEGIREVHDAEERDGYVYYRHGPGSPFETQVKLGRDFFMTRDEAEKALRKLVLRKITAHQKQIAKLEQVLKELR